MDALKRRLPILVIAASLGVMASGLAQTPPPQPPPTQGKSGERGRDRMKERFLENLDPEARERFQKVRQQALQDPAVQELRKKADEANREFFKAIRDKMQELDPGLAEIIKEKVKNRPDAGPGKGWGDGGKGQGFGNLSEEEKARLMAAREKAKADPAVQAAEKKKEEAPNPQERMTAGGEYRKAMHAAMLKADPSLEPILEKMEPPKAPVPQPPAPGGDGDNEMMEKR